MKNNDSIDKNIAFIFLVLGIICAASGLYIYTWIYASWYWIMSLYALYTLTLLGIVGILGVSIFVDF